MTFSVDNFRSLVFAAPIFLSLYENIIPMLCHMTQDNRLSLAFVPEEVGSN